MAKTAIALAIILVAVTSVPSQEWLPPELRGLPPGDSDAFRSAIETKLQSMLGQPFPDWKLANRDGTRSLLSISSGPIVLLYAGGPCPATLEEMRRLAESGWSSPEGTLVTVLKNKGAFRERVIKRATKGHPHVYYLETFDEDGLMNYIRAYPTYLYLDSGHKFVAFQVADRKRFEIRSLESGE